MQDYTHQVREIIVNKRENIPLAYVETFGCQQNVSDSEKIKGVLTEMGYGTTNSSSNADFIIFNTCAVRATAQDKVFGIIGEMSHVKKQNSNAIIAMCGCMMEQSHIVERIKKSYPFVDIVFGTSSIHKLPELIYTKLTTQKRVFYIDSEKEIEENIPLKRDSNVKANLPIMYGCNNFCTYCIVPFVRGRERSRKRDAILKEAVQLIDNGYKEITLLGQNVNSYGKELGISFPELLQDINNIAGEFKISFMTSHPKDCTKELINTIASCEKISRHIHLPIQSGSDRILNAMNRGYTVEEYMSLVEYARNIVPEVSFTTDIIVGFPGETYEDFRETIKCIKSVKFDALYTFIYSKREGTKAAEFLDSIPYSEKSKWFKELIDIQSNINDKKYEAMLGKTYRVLIEDGFGKTDNNVMVKFEDKIKKDIFVDMKIVKTFKNYVVGIQ